MDYGLAREIYGLGAWCIDPISLQSMTAILRNLQNGVQLSIPEIKYNQLSLYNVDANTLLVDNSFQLNNKEDFNAIGVINLNGVITKNGGASSNGTKMLSNEMLKMSKDERVKGFIILTDSGGGSSVAVELMVNAINEVKKTKPVYTLVEKGGMMASAAYGIGSAGNKIFAEEGMSVVGSVGTMISFEGRPANTTAPDGTKNIVLYATKSTHKNKAFEEALNNDNYDLLINEMLDPVNENFINLVLNNRPQLQGTNFDNGHTLFAKDSIGTFIDGIASFEEVVQMVLNDSKNYINTNTSLTLNSSKMTKDELKQSHPELYSSVIKDGANAELDRVQSWMVFANADLEAVTNGINSGEQIKQSEIVKLSVKMNAKTMLDNLQSDSANEVVTEETPTVIDEVEEKENGVEKATNFYKSLTK